MNMTYNSEKSLSNLDPPWFIGTEATIARLWFNRYSHVPEFCVYLAWGIASLGPYIALSDVSVLTQADNADIAERPPAGSKQTDNSWGLTGTSQCHVTSTQQLAIVLLMHVQDYNNSLLGQNAR